MKFGSLNYFSYLCCVIKLLMKKLILKYLNRQYLFDNGFIIHDEFNILYIKDDLKAVFGENTLKEFEKYRKDADSRTNITLKKFYYKIRNIEIQGKEYGYSLDHKYSVYDGFINNVDPEIIAHWKNLECIPELENSKKSKKSSITLEELLNQINEVT